MAEADPESSDTSESVDVKRNSSAPLFSIHAFFVGFGAKDSDSGRSPTSPLDFSLFGGLFSPRSPPPHRNRWACDKVGLSVLSSSDEGQIDDLFTRDNIVLAHQIKPPIHQLFDPCLKSNSLPKNYVLPSLSSDAVNIHPLPCDSITDANSPRRSSSSPMDIIISCREMALSEDYTCIISHGPNPKTTHIFGDCILDCDPKELGTKEEIEKPEGNSLPDDYFSTGNHQNCQKHIHKHSETASAEKGSVEDSLEISPGSSYNEDLFPMAINASSILKDEPF